MAWRYLKMVSGGSSSTETNPYEINILAGATQCQKGGSIEADRPPMWSQVTALIDGNLTTATYWDAGFNPTIIVTMPVGHTDLTEIQIPCTYDHFQHTVYLSQDKIEWIECPFLSWTNLDKQQNFSIPAEPATQKSFTANAALNITRFTYGAAQDYTIHSFSFEQSATLDLNFVDAAEKIYTANGYEFNQWSLDFLDDYYYTDQIYTPNGYGYEANNVGISRNVRYIRDYCAQSTVNSAAIWSEIKVFRNGENIALNNVPLTSKPLVGGAAILTNGILSPLDYAFVTTFSTPQFVDIDLGQIYSDLDEVKIWHYYDDGRIFEKTKVQVSTDAINWTTLFDSDISGTYVETAEGLTVKISEGLFLSLTETAYQEYTANGYSFMGVDEQEIIFDFSAAQEYVLNGYSFEQTSQENIFFDFLGAESYTADGYDVAAMAQENILLISLAEQTYTLNGLSFEAASENVLTDLVDAAALFFQANFRGSKEELFFLGMEASQTYIPYFEMVSLATILLTGDAAQQYSLNGYSKESIAAESVEMDFSASQIFTAHFEMSTSDPVTLFFDANTEYQANFISSAAQTISITESSFVTAVYSEGLQFQENAQEDLSFSLDAAQNFIAFSGYEFVQNQVANPLVLSDSGTSRYELGETGKYTEWVNHTINLQVAAQLTYDRNWMVFESAANELLSDFNDSALNIYQRVYINENTATESLSYFISPLQFYGKYFEAISQDNMDLSISVISEHSVNYLTFEMNANDFFFIHFTDINLYTMNYLQFKQDMYYDFWFWDYADSLYAQNKLSFESNVAEIIDLTMNSDGQYINANWILSVAEENFSLVVQAESEYLHIQVIESRVTESLYLQGFGTLLVTTEPRNYMVTSELLLNLIIDSWTYFESDIYVPTYKLEITKPNTMWEPTKADRVMVDQNKVPSQGMDYSDTSFGDKENIIADRRILSLTDIKDPNKISYESEIKKPNTLYVINSEEQKGLSND